jgi:hypothetical protein
MMEDIDGWLEIWTEDGIIETPFGNSKGKTSLRVFLTGYFEIACFLVLEEK